MANKSYVTENTKSAKPWNAGKRTIQKQNYSYILTVPRIWVDTFCENNKEVNLHMENSGMLTVMPCSIDKEKEKKK